MTPSKFMGGAGFFTDQPFERMMRDVRFSNLIGEGANDVLRSFIAMVGLRPVGQKLQGILKRPWKAWELLQFSSPRIYVPHPRLQSASSALSRQVKQFGRACQSTLIRHREEILEHQLVKHGWETWPRNYSWRVACIPA